MSAARVRVCLHAPYLYPLFGGPAIEFTGGAEEQQALLARGLVARGFDVSVVSCDFGQPTEVTVDGIRFLRSYAMSAGVPVLRFLHPRLVRTVAALSRADAEVYYARAAGLPAGVASDVARRRGAAFVFAAAHDHDARACLPHLSRARDRWWYRRALRHADRIVAQSVHQQRLFADEYGRASEVVPNMVVPPPVPVDAGRDGVVLWLSTWKAAKRPEWMTALARSMPERRFVMCGVIPPPSESGGAWEAANAAARACPNLEIAGFVPHARIGDWFGRAALFAHTSPAEGFPNTLLEAWAQGVPSVSVVDPDGVIAEHQIGSVAATPEAFADEVRRWMDDPAARRAAGERARKLVQSRHDPARTLDRMATLFDELATGVRRRRAST